MRKNEKKGEKERKERKEKRRKGKKEKRKKREKIKEWQMPHSYILILYFHTFINNSFFYIYFI